MSTAPRPTSWPSRIRASNGGTVQSAVGAGTTSVCAISISEGPSPRALDSRDQVEALRVGADELALDPGAAQVVGEQLGGRGLVAGRVRGVDADQGLRQADDLVARSGPPIARPGQLTDHPRSGTPPASSRRASRRAGRRRGSCRPPRGPPPRRRRSRGRGRRWRASPRCSGREREPDLTRPLAAVGPRPREPEQRPQRQPAQLLRAHRRIGRADRDARAGRGGLLLDRVEMRAEQVEALAVAEVAQQQHADVVVADQPARRCRSRPGTRSTSSPCPAPTLPSATSLPRLASARSTSPVVTLRESALQLSSHSPTTGSTILSGPRPEASTAAWWTMPTACDPQR